MTLHKILFFLSITLLLSCGRGKNAHTAAAGALPPLDTADADATYGRLRVVDIRLADSAYYGIASALTEQRKFPLLFRHLGYYRKVAGASPRVEALTALTNGFYQMSLHNRDSASVYLKDAVKRYEQLHMSRELAAACMELTSNYIYQGDYPGALASQYKALHLYEALNDSAGIYTVRTHMLLVLTEQQEYAKAIDMALSNIGYYSRNHNAEMLSHNESQLSSGYYRTSEDKKAMDYAVLALAHARESGNAEYVSQCLSSLAVAYSAQGDWDKTVAAMRESLMIETPLHDRTELITAKFNLAAAMWKSGERDSAVQMLDTLIGEALRYRQVKDIVSIYKTLYVINREEQNYGKAMDYMKLYYTWRDSIHSNEQDRAIHELNIKYESSKKQEQIAELKGEKAADSFKKIIYLMLLAGTAISAVLAVLFLRNRNRKNELLMERVQLELAANKSELQYFTENILQKNKFIQELEQKLSNATQQAIVTEQAIAMEESNEQLSELYQFKILTEDDWREFKIRFDKVHPGLINRLRERYPDLSPAEERQFLLIRLNIDNKECADMLGISMLGVKKNRYRLKKRFNLGEADNLDEFVKGFQGGQA